MGSGKTHWAVKLSASLNIPVFDLDAEIEKAENKTIAEHISACFYLVNTTWSL